MSTKPLLRLLLETGRATASDSAIGAVVCEEKRAMKERLGLESNEKGRESNVSNQMLRLWTQTDDVRTTQKKGNPTGSKKAPIARHRLNRRHLFISN